MKQIALFLLLSSLILCSCSDSEIKKEYLAEEIELSKKIIFEFSAQGFLKELDCESRRAMIDPEIWQQIDYDTKQSATIAISTACAIPEKQSFHAIKLIDNQTGHELAEITWIGNISIK